MRSAHEKSAFLLLSSRYAYLISEKAVVTRKTPKPISQGYQSRSRGEAGTTAQTSLMGPVTICHNWPIQRYWHMGNNGIGILNMPQVWYGQQRYRHIANNAFDLCAQRHTALLAYAHTGILRQRTMRLCAYAPYGIQRYQRMIVCLYAPCRIKRYRRTILCFCAHKGLLQMRRNSNMKTSLSLYASSEQKNFQKKHNTKSASSKISFAIRS